jgi:hypothetical protein
MASYQLAYDDESKLSIDQVTRDYEAAAVALGLDKPGIQATLRSAMDGAKSNPRQLDIPTNGNKPTATTPKANLVLAPTYTALEDYAIAHGCPVSAYEDAKWSEQDSPRGKCLLHVPCEDGVTRVRYLDGESPKWMPIKPPGMEGKITPCWYGFTRAIAMAKASTHKTVVICNGQPSVIAAQYHSIPAIAQTDGEGKLITKPLLKRLKTAISENRLSVILAYDGDDTGREATKKVLEQLQANSIPVKVVHFGGDKGFDLADYCKRWKSQTMTQLQRLAAYSVRVKSDEHKTEGLAYSMEGILANDDDEQTPGASIAIPFKSFHHLGGYAYMTAPGKLAMIMAPSGHGKTSFMETWADLWLKTGIDVLWYSPEWDAMETHWRRIQRNGGATYDQIRELVMYRNEEFQGIPKEKRIGKLLTPELHKKTRQVNQSIVDTWPGKIFCYRAQRLTETVLGHMSKRLQLQRREGRRVGVAVFDYMQLMRTQQEIAGKNTYEVIGDMLKDWCVENHVFGLVGMQVKKSSGKTDSLLGMYDAQWVRPDIFNLIVTLNITEQEVFSGGIGTGRMEKQELATANVCKNSTGQIGEVQVRTNFRYLAWKEA